jgi:hypothetical protein
VALELLGFIAFAAVLLFGVGILGILLWRLAHSCLLGHRWDPWQSVPGVTEVYSGDDGGRPIRREQSLVRKCKSCGLVKTKIVRVG